MTDERPKTAYEIAMERFRGKDEGAEPPLTDEQKAAIAEARQIYRARVAEREVLHQAARRAATSHEELDRLNDQFRRDNERLASDRDRKIAEIKGEKPPSGEPAPDDHAQ